ncbi:MAG TPA: hypothetical protein VKB51_11835 [bacterium]|nr:hypothetical protein [bacterium]
MRKVEANVVRRRPRSKPQHYTVVQQAKWVAARLVFYTYIGFSLGTLGIGGFLTGPMMTWYFYGDWRFWRHWQSAKGLFSHGYRMLWYILQGQNGGFMLGVPLTAPPFSAANREVVELQPTWEFGSSCGPCNRCCSKIKCPVLDTEKGLCRGYDSFFWRYFNCGRFPSEQREVDFYLCNKWGFKDRPSEQRPQPGLAPAPEEMVA